MRLVKVSAPEGHGKQVIDLAFALGIKTASLSQVEAYRVEKSVQVKDIVDIQTSTPEARSFINELLRADFYDQEEYSISMRQPASILSSGNVQRLTKPLVVPPSDILEELWQFSHINISFVGRIFIASSLLAFGIINHQLLVMIAGLLFLPLLPLLLAVSFGTLSGQWRLVTQGLLSFAAALLLLMLGGVLVASFSSPPLLYDEFNSPWISLLISTAVGIAAVLANVDDTGKRELIGLAATSQIAIIPVWFGIALAFGFPPLMDSGQVATRVATFILNIVSILIASLITYYFLGASDSSLKRTSGKTQ
jgi:Domain of unknown function (DUF389)